MSQEIMTETASFENVTNALTEATTTLAMLTTEYEEPATNMNFSTTRSFLNTSGVKQLSENETDSTSTVFEAFIMTEIVMTAIELTISILAAIKMPRWRRNYRNQMLMQLSAARFLKRILFLFQLLKKHENIFSSEILTCTLGFFRIYMDFVVVILVFFFIKHMYNSLIIVMVKISQNNFYRVLCCSWLLPVPISGLGIALMETGLIDHWWLYLLVCCLFRWPLIFSGTALYVMIVYKVMSDKIREYARILTVVTFLLCLIINFYLFSKDIIELWCLGPFAAFEIQLASSISGLIMNFLILCFYVVLIILNIKNNPQFSRSLPDYSIGDGNKL